MPSTVNSLMNACRPRSCGLAGRSASRAGGRLACLLLGLVLLAPAADAAVEGIRLRLERALGDAPPAPLDEGTAVLLRFGVGEITQQIALTRDRIARLERTNQELDAALRGGDELLSELRTLDEAQGRTGERMREAVDAREAAAGTVAPVRVAPQAPARPVRTVAVPTAAVARSPDVAGIGLPHWALGLGLGAILVALLAGVVVLLRSRRRALDPDPRSSDPHHGTPARGPAAGTGPRTAGPQDATRDFDVDGVDWLPGDEDAATPDAAPAQARERWSPTTISQKAANPQALKEVDTLIAFEQYENARALLDEMLVADPDDPELLLRHYHVRTQGGVETTDDDEALLRAMMDGPLSDTLLRVREIGRGLMPGDPLFQDPAQRAAASHVLKENKEPKGGRETDGRRDGAPARDTVVPFTGTVKLARSPLAGKEAP